MKVVINNEFGGFSLSESALVDLGTDYINPWDKEERINERLINLIETKGTDYVGGTYAKLSIVEIPDNLKHWFIDEYDGNETIIASETELFFFS